MKKDIKQVKDLISILAIIILIMVVTMGCTQEELEQSVNVAQGVNDATAGVNPYYLITSTVLAGLGWGVSALGRRKESKKKDHWLTAIDNAFNEGGDRGTIRMPDLQKYLDSEAKEEFNGKGTVRTL